MPHQIRITGPQTKFRPLSLTTAGSDVLHDLATTMRNLNGVEPVRSGSNVTLGPFGNPALFSLARLNTIVTAGANVTGLPTYFAIPAANYQDDVTASIPQQTTTGGATLKWSEWKHDSGNYTHLQTTDAATYWIPSNSRTRRWLDAATLKQLNTEGVPIKTRAQFDAETLIQAT